MSATDKTGGVSSGCAKTGAIKDEAIRRGLHRAEGQFSKLSLSPPSESNRTDKAKLLQVLGITEVEYIAQFTNPTHIDWRMTCTALKVARAAEEPPPAKTKRAA